MPTPRSVKISKSNEWLSNATAGGLSDLGKATRARARGATLLVALLAFAFVAVIYSLGGGWGLMPTIACENPALGRPQPSANYDGRSLQGYPMAGIVGIVLPLNLALGVFCTCFSLVLLDFFRLHANARTAASAWAANNAFGAYLVQAYVIVPLVFPVGFRCAGG